MISAERRVLAREIAQVETSFARYRVTIQRPGRVRAGIINLPPVSRRGKRRAAARRDQRGERGFPQTSR